MGIKIRKVKAGSVQVTGLSKADKQDLIRFAAAAYDYVLASGDGVDTENAREAYWWLRAEEKRLTFDQRRLLSVINDPSLI
jgi:hypothetical protein